MAARTRTNVETSEPRSLRRRRNVVPDVDHALPNAVALLAPDRHGLAFHRDLLSIGTAERHTIRAGRVRKIDAAGYDNVGRLPGNAEAGRLKALRHELSNGRASNHGRTRRREGANDSLCTDNGNSGDGARWAATAIDDNSITFEPTAKAQNSFRWEHASASPQPNEWKAVLWWPAANNKAAGQRIYRMERWPPPKP